MMMITGNEDVVVIGADTIVSHKGHILTKPKDTGNAFDILRNWLVIVIGVYRCYTYQE